MWRFTIVDDDVIMNSYIRNVTQVENELIQDSFGMNRKIYGDEWENKPIWDSFVIYWKNQSRSSFQERDNRHHGNSVGKKILLDSRDICNELKEFVVT